MVLHGYGKVLDIDLSTMKIMKGDIDPQFALEFVGGMGYGGKILYDEVGADINPLSPANVVIFANGPLRILELSFPLLLRATGLCPPGPALYKPQPKGHGDLKG